jgi:hypothetical protein
VGRSRGACFSIALVAGLTVGVAYPQVSLWRACRAADSEACVWGQALLPLTRSVSIVILGGAVTALLYALLRWRSVGSRDDR